MNVILTGPSRSGTTLTCHLLNRLPETIALVEPLQLTEGERSSPAGALEAVERFFVEMRERLSAEGDAISRHVAGTVPDDPMAPRFTGGNFWLRRFLLHLPQRLAHRGRLRRPMTERGDVHFDKELSPDFLLAIKHPELFTALLPWLVERYPCFALIRNPLATLGSWNSVEVPVGRGRATAAERLDPELERLLTGERDRTTRQLHLLNWYYERFALLPAERVLRYEQIVASGGRALVAVTPRAATLDVPLQNRNANPLYDRRVMRRLGARLLASDGAYWHFYERAEVEALIDALDEA